MKTDDENLFLNPFIEIRRHGRDLPHWQQKGVYCFVTWRLADALSQSQLNQWQDEKQAWLRLHPEPWDEATEHAYHQRFTQQMEDWLDAGAGSCLFRDSIYAGIVADALHHFDGERYALDSFVVMPNHVHALFSLYKEMLLEDVMKSWKGWTAREINRLQNRSGTVWSANYRDRLIRNAEHMMRCRDYIRKNPQKAKLREGEYVLYIKEDGAKTQRTE